MTDEEYAEYARNFKTRYGIDALPKADVENSRSGALLPQENAETLLKKLQRIAAIMGGRVAP